MARIGYARVSTTEQNLDGQTDELTKHGCSRIFKDHGVSGTLASRPEWDKCLERLEPGDTLVVTKLDRLGRNTRNLVGLVETLQEDGKDLAILDMGGQAIDTGTPLGKCFYTIMAAFAELERNLTRERTMMGLAAARARGRKGGRKPKLTPEQQETLRTMYEAKGNDGKRLFTVQDIAAALKIHKTTVYDYLNREEKTA